MKYFYNIYNIYTFFIKDLDLKEKKFNNLKFYNK